MPNANSFKVGDKVRFTDKHIDLTRYEQRWMTAGIVYEVLTVQDGVLTVHLTPLMDGTYSFHYFEKA